MAYFSRLCLQVDHCWIRQPYSWAIFHNMVWIFWFHPAVIHMAEFKLLVLGLWQCTHGYTVGEARIWQWLTVLWPPTTGMWTLHDALSFHHSSRLPGSLAIRACRPQSTPPRYLPGLPAPHYLKLSRFLDCLVRDHQSSLPYAFCSSIRWRWPCLPPHHY